MNADLLRSRLRRHRQGCIRCTIHPHSPCADGSLLQAQLDEAAGVETGDVEPVFCDSVCAELGS